LISPKNRLVPTLVLHQLGNAALRLSLLHAVLKKFPTSTSPDLDDRKLLDPSSLSVLALISRSTHYL
jgi:hypothetical protein